MSIIRDKLLDGDLRTIGKVVETVGLVKMKPELAEELVRLLTDESAGVRMRAADALEKVSQTDPGWLQAYSAELVKIMQQTGQQEVQWHLAQILPKLDLTDSQQEKVWKVCDRLFDNSPSAIVQASCLEALWKLSDKYGVHRQRASRLLLSALTHSKAAVRARAKKLLG